MDGSYKIDIPFAHKNGEIVNCEKCKIESTFFYVSIINKAIICPSCFLKEKQEKEYISARELNRLAILRGDTGFSGTHEKKKDFKIEL